MRSFRLLTHSKARSAFVGLLLRAAARPIITSVLVLQLGRNPSGFRDSLALLKVLTLLGEEAASVAVPDWCLHLRKRCPHHAFWGSDCVLTPGRAGWQQ